MYVAICAGLNITTLLRYESGFIARRLQILRLANQNFLWPSLFIVTNVILTCL